MDFRTRRVLFSTPFYMLFEFFLLKYIFLLFGGLDDSYLLIFDMKMEGNLTEYGMAIELGVSESTITYQWKKVKQKILKVI